MTERPKGWFLERRKKKVSRPETHSLATFVCASCRRARRLADFKTKQMVLSTHHGPEKDVYHAHVVSVCTACHDRAARTIANSKEDRPVLVTRAVQRLSRNIRATIGSPAGESGAG